MCGDGILAEMHVADMNEPQRTYGAAIAQDDASAHAPVGQGSPAFQAWHSPLLWQANSTPFSQRVSAC
jgi:hypothetical protein